MTHLTKFSFHHLAFGSVTRTRFHQIEAGYFSNFWLSLRWNIQRREVIILSHRLRWTPGSIHGVLRSIPGVQAYSRWSPGVCAPVTSQSPWSPCGVYLESTWSPHIIHISIREGDKEVFAVSISSHAASVPLMFCSCFACMCAHVGCLLRQFPSCIFL